MNNSQRAGVVQMVLAMILSGTIGAFVTESRQNAFNVVFLRCIFGATTLAAVCHFRGYFRASHFTPRNVFLGTLGGVALVFNWVLLFSSYRLTSISMGTIVYHTQPFYVVLLGAIVFKERITLNKVFWIGLAFIGVTLVTDLVHGRAAGFGPGYLRGVVYALVAAILYAVATITTKKLTGVPPHLIAFCQTTLGALLLPPFTALGELRNAGPAWGYLVCLGVVHTGLMYILLYAAFQKLETTRIAVLSFIYPAVALLVDAVLYHTRIAALQWLGAALIVLASFAMNRGWGARIAGARARVSGV